MGIIRDDSGLTVTGRIDPAILDEVLAEVRMDEGPARAEPRRLGRPVLTTHPLIRFGPELFASAKRLADADGKTASTWIRDVVAAEIERRTR